MKARKLTSDIIKTLIPLGISAGLVLWLFHKVNFRQVQEIMQRGVEWQWLALMGVLLVASRMIRGIRWGIQLRAAGIPRMSVNAEASAIFGAYALNLVVPFVGEAWRCIVVSRRQKAKLSTVVGTDLGDRLSDAAMISLFIIAAFFVSRPAMLRFMDRYPIGEKISAFTTNPLFWVAVVGVLALLGFLDFTLRKTRFVQGVNLSAKRLWQGFAVLFHMKGIGQYVLLTFAIWGCYFALNWVCLYAFPFTRSLVAGDLAHSLEIGLVMFVFGSVSMAVPSNGGLGPWNIAVMFALSLYGVRDSDGVAFSLLVWSVQAVIQALCGLYALAYELIKNNRHFMSSILSQDC